MKQFVFLIMFLGLGSDIMLDSAAADHQNVPVCHACTCIHIANTAGSRPVHVAPLVANLVRTNPNLPDFLSDKSIFHPPKAFA